MVKADDRIPEIQGLSFLGSGQEAAVSISGSSKRKSG
jgi:hypothetical protein